MFKIFKKDYRHFLEKGDRLFKDGCFADARHEYQEALERLPGDVPGHVSEHLGDRLRSIGNELACMNLREAAHALQRGEIAKAQEHAELAYEQAEDEVIRGNARDFQRQLSHDTPVAEPATAGHSCSGCNPAHNTKSATSELNTDFLSEHDRFELLVQTLPGNLPDRYRQMGERFAYAYIAIHDERLHEGYKILKELSVKQTNDILEYETALIDFHSGSFAECERRLRVALSMRPDNPLCHLGLVQLMLETGRLRESLPMLEHMIAADHLGDQALVLSGDVLLALGETDRAVDIYVSALNIPSVAKTAAQKIVPVLEELGRSADAQAIVKRYLKGCC